MEFHAWEMPPDRGVKAYGTEAFSIHFSCLIRPAIRPPSDSRNVLLRSLFPKSCGPTPLAKSSTEPCVRQCQDSSYVIQPSPVLLTLPGPILSSFPQNSAVGSSTSAAVGSALSSERVPISPGSLGGFLGPSRRYSSRLGELC